MLQAVGQGDAHPPFQHFGAERAVDADPRPYVHLHVLVTPTKFVSHTQTPASQLCYSRERFENVGRLADGDFVEHLRVLAGYVAALHQPVLPVAVVHERDAPDADAQQHVVLAQYDQHGGQVQVAPASRKLVLKP